ncbi:hypothetical protein COU95_01275 [Candidatus Shapirobacteria bacterium CG10_big_fil_rev_8_21_14_0_10_40_9]|uniref:Uncharacterized protein n=1 Tax=Candidatus Shapirobacteria bacterium CG10_big_fil_rev_8_21_14_0_10_40_9 TaxID=1974888 RepID=A0A2M8L3Z3_9BACT|nr:MAG: hypothetical protein COU95_01275 [Candidatus Shapirobacteria bacterium CG10_big_fil_rev_8_21_14_0_10_40_9]
MSKKKNIVILGVGIAILFVLGILVFLKTQKPSSLVSPLPEEEMPAETETGKLLYEDEAGFSFQYPQTLGIVEKDVSDPNTYSSLELLSKSHPEEKMVVKIIDADFSTIEVWLKNNPQEGKLVSEKEVSLSEMKGKSFQYADPSKNLILVIDSGILYRLEAPDSDFWRSAFETISSTFKLTEEQTSSGGTGSSIIEEEEEVIE